MGLVWYVAYGSNMVAERLQCYLAGGTPPGAGRTYLGGRDPSPPRDSRPVTVAHHLFFAGASRVWGGGGVAFVEPRAARAARTPAVAHLLTTEQLADLVAQENGGEAPGPAVDALPAEGHRQELTFARYDLLVGVAPIEGVPAALLTTSLPPPVNPPSPAYEEMLCRGRRRWHGEAGA